MARSWFRNVFDFTKTAISTQGEDFILEQLGSVNGILDQPKKIDRDLDYLTIRVRSSRIVDIRRWTTKFYGSIQSRVFYLHNERGLVEYQKVLSPEKMRELDPSNIDRLVEVDKPVIGPVPYLGEFSVELGLFSVKGSDLAAPYIDLLTDIAEKSSVGFFSAALPYVETLRKGADQLFGNNQQSSLEIGLDRSWRDVTTGTWLLMRARKGGVNVADLRLDTSDGSITLEGGEPFRKYPYIVFSIAASRRRDDWMTIPELKTAWDAVAAAVKGGETDKAEQLLRQFSLIAQWSPDLVPDDAKRLERKGQDKLGLIQPKTTVAREDDNGFPDFKDLNLYDY